MPETASKDRAGQSVPGTRGVRRSADEGLRGLVREFIAALLKLPKSERPKARVLRMIQSQLPPFRGRPADPLIQRALKLRARNLKTDQICRIWVVGLEGTENRHRENTTP